MNSQIHQHPPEIQIHPLRHRRYRLEVALDLDPHRPLHPIHGLHHRSIEDEVEVDIVIPDLEVEDDGTMIAVHIDHGVVVAVVAEEGVVVQHGIEAVIEAEEGLGTQEENTVIMNIGINQINDLNLEDKWILSHLIMK